MKMASSLDFILLDLLVGLIFFQLLTPCSDPFWRTRTFTLAGTLAVFLLLLSVAGYVLWQEKPKEAVSQEKETEQKEKEPAWAQEEQDEG